MGDDWLGKLVPKHPLWFVWAGGSISLLWLFVWWSVGAFPTEAFGGGFAKVEDAKFNTQMALESRLLDIRIKQCLAVDDSKVYYTSELIRLKDLYHEKLDKEYDERPCKEVVVVPAAIVAEDNS